MLKFRGSQHLRQRLICATLSGKAIRVDGIRERDQNPGLRDYEACLLRLIEKVTDGCVIEINETGTSLRYKPGLVTGGSGLNHDCGKSRSIGYFLEPLVCLALFGKKPLSISLHGITNDGVDSGVDVWQQVTLPLIRQLADIEKDGLQMKVYKRGAPPGGGGEVHLSVPVARALPPISLTEEGMVKSVRGVAYAVRVAPAAANRMVDGSRGVLNELLADVRVFTDHRSGAEAGASPGYGLTLVAQTTTGRLISAQAVAPPAAKVHPHEGQQAQRDVGVPEDIGRTAAHALFEEISRGGICDSAHQGLVLLFCALGPEELNEVRLGPLTPHAVRTLRHLKAFFGVTFSVKPQAASSTIFLSCIGAGVKNMSKRVS
ncbi:putative RNA 3'-terminal phosphate cyclase [Coccomyxa subellipsoidea C-169]|uniref:RNA 3'-terminal phosphate cyclase n=1 Tax=Coccomyxa subellipsoidea (strain C-169) TaxID=574566 RepID=I0YKR8_COCSC|nr:putative RNA 3'-terminal phosphate cyclase [Coccomyxa subellipsoidea C-169]EIE18987.1 putative RNA 3'-terminal phosphate cyclase [Coccomyxa subellipsoidea C-169]|eukprot:XP_005643531.1 putative RNA 3'-terminal phosphate cyclase [Coccomyxa subellipsoidea C-169]